VQNRFVTPARPFSSMMEGFVLHPLKSRSKNRTPGHRFPRRFRARLHVEELESRTLLSVYTPLQIRAAYGVNNIAFPGSVTGDGSGQTIAIVDAYYDPTITADVATFSQRFGLAPLDGKNGDGTFTQVDLSGKKTQSPPGDDWTVETALDVEWAHAMAPKANIVLVEAASDNVDASGKPADLLNAVQYAATRTGAATVSMSWGISEVPGEKSWDSYFTTPGVTFVAASGDSGAGTIWPAVSPNVVSVGGTSLRLTSSNTISSERGWGNSAYSFYFGGSGGGFSQYEPLPAFQQNAGISSTYTQFKARLNPDVAYNADPNTGYYVVDGADGGWFAVGGTSAGAPQWAALIAIADQGRAAAKLSPLSSAQTLSALYSNPQDFHDITAGNTGSYAIVNSRGQITGIIPVSAGTGYDLVTGLGSPVANTLVPALAKVGVPAAPKVAVAATVSSGGSSSRGSGTAARTADVPASSSTPATQNNAASASNGLLLASLTVVPVRPVVVTPPNPGSFAVVAVVPTTPAASVLLASNSAASPHASTGPGPTISNEANPNADDETPTPSAAVVAPVIPAAPASQNSAPAGTNPAPVVPSGLESGFIPDEDLSETGQDPDSAAVAGATVASVSQAGSVAVLALAIALAWDRRSQVKRTEIPIRRRCRG
jgi:subtilase family serine protease